MGREAHELEPCNNNTNAVTNCLSLNHISFLHGRVCVSHIRLISVLSKGYQSLCIFPTFSKHGAGKGREKNWGFKASKGNSSSSYVAKLPLKVMFLAGDKTESGRETRTNSLKASRT